MEYFKGDANEIKMAAVLDPLNDQIALQLELANDGAYECQKLGALIYDAERSPLATGITRQIFIENFKEIFDSLIEGGTFESYMTVFRKIFGDTVDVEFTVPGPGRLQIDIEADGVLLSDFVARRIVSNAYYFDEVVDEESDNIVFQTVAGFESQYELENMLFEMVPNGIFTEISLTVG